MGGKQTGGCSRPGLAAGSADSAPAGRAMQAAAEGLVVPGAGQGGRRPGGL